MKRLLVAAALITFLAGPLSANEWWMPSPISVAITVGQWLMKDREQVYYLQVRAQGRDEKHARNQAFRLAVEQAIGALVLAETEVRRGNVERNDVISYSSGFVHDFKILEQRTVNGVHEIVVDVWVARSHLADRLLSTIRSRCQAIPFARLACEPLQQVLAAQPSPTQPDPPELLELAAGSPGAVLEHRQQWHALPEGLAQRCAELIGPTPQAVSPVAALSLARDLCDALEVEQQLWLLDWWQLHLWRLSHQPAQQQRIELLRRQLRSFVQPRLAWEVALLELSGWMAA